MRYARLIQLREYAKTCPAGSIVPELIDYVNELRIDLRERWDTLTALAMEIEQLRAENAELRRHLYGN